MSVSRQLLQQASWPALANFMQQATSTITVLYATGLKDHYILGAIGVAAMVQNVFGFSIGAGLAGGLDTLMSQSNGAGRYDQSRIFVQQAQVLCLLVVPPCALILALTQPLLRLVGLDERVAQEAGSFTAVCIWTLPFSYLFQVDCSVLRAIKNPTAVFSINVVVVLLHLIICPLLLNVFHLGAMGAGLSRAIVNFLRFAFLRIYIEVEQRKPDSHVLRESWCRWPSIRALRSSQPNCWAGLRQYLAVAIPSSLILWAEWWVYEVTSLLAGYCGPEALAAHVACQQITALVFMLPYGIGSGTAALVGNFIGAGDLRMADAVTWGACRWTFAIALACAIFFVLVREPVAHLFSDNPGVIATEMAIAGPLAIFIMVDSLQTVLEGAIKGFGLQAKASTAKITTMFAVRLFGGWLLAFPLGVGVLGIWWSGVLGMVVTLVVYSWVLRPSSRHAAAAAPVGAPTCNVPDEGLLES